MSVVIKGTQVKEDSLIEFLLDLQDRTENDNKRRKIDSGSYHVPLSEGDTESSFSFAAPLPQTVYDLALDGLKAAYKSKEQNLSINWNYTNLGDSTFATMIVHSSLTNKAIIEHECLLLSTEFQEDNTTTIENDNQLFTAITYVVSLGLLEISGVKLRPCQSDDRCMLVSIDLYYSMKPEHKSKATTLITKLSRSINIKTRRQPLQSVGVELKKKRKTNSPKMAAPQEVPPEQAKSTTLINDGDMIHKQDQHGLPDVNQPVASNSEAASNSLPKRVCNEQLLYAQSQSFVSPLKKSKAAEISPPIPTSGSIEAFYNFLQPPVLRDFLTQYVSPKIMSKLTPFQTQNVEWMIHREGHYVTSNGSVKPDVEIYSGLPLLYSGKHDNLEKGKYVNMFDGKVITDRSKISDLIQKSYTGGILADEMGLGKTVSVLGLITKHAWCESDPFHPKPLKNSELKLVTGTLIITPASIIQQWLTEIEKHTPSLRVFVYQGRRVQPNITSEYFEQFDVVLTHYEAFKSEIHYAKPVGKRPRRSGVIYKNSFKRSPLVTALWFRCILDEAQMIEAPLTSISSLSKLIPCWYSWAVTGTPMKDNFTDLFGLFDFLDKEETFNQKLFNIFCKDPRHNTTFYNFMRATMRRNMKTALKDQVYIPKQNRHVVRIPFTTIEQHHYDDLWRNCRHDLQLDWMDSINWKLPSNADESMIADFNTIKQKMRSWLLALRQNCVHPSMISNTLMRITNTPYTTNSAIQSLDQVLKNMASEAKISLNHHRHAYYTCQLKIGGMYEVLNEWENARETYETHVSSVESATNALSSLILTRKNKDDKNDNYEKQLPTSLNRWQFLLHQYYFYMAGVFHRLELQDAEDLYYSKAAAIRRVLLETYTTRVKNCTLEIQKSYGKIQPSDERLRMGAREFDSSFLSEIEYDDENDSDEDSDNEESSERASDMNMIENVKQLGAILDNQYDKIIYLRDKIMPMLRKPLVDSGENESEVTGDEYENSLAEQEMCQIYLSAYQALLNDRRFIIKGTFLAQTDVNSHDNGEFISEEGKNIDSTEKAFRQALKNPRGFTIECLNDVEFSLRTLRNRLAKEKRFNTAFNVLTAEHAHLASKIPIQSKLLEDLDSDLKKLNELFNSRVAYYKYLQQISDTLLDWKHRDPSAAIERLKKEATKLEELISQGNSRDQYLTALMEENKSLEEQVRKDCLICQETIEKGMITYCGHTSCIDCGLKWFKKSQRCHTCNSKVYFNEWYNISYKKIEIHDKEVGPTNSDEKVQKLISEINEQKIVEGRGAKLDSIIKHIKHIKETTNGKCIVFSQWTKALDILKHGLSLNNIRYTTINTGATVNRNNAMEFQTNPDINVILLHARSQSSGLTLVAAHTVFIVEPVINESLEKQAINRIHRIGQTKETNVFWYIVQDTIEERIQAIHDVKRSQSGALELTTDTKKQELSKLSDGGGEYVDNEDLRRCFTSNFSE